MLAILDKNQWVFTSSGSREPRSRESMLRAIDRRKRPAHWLRAWNFDPSLNYAPPPSPEPGYDSDTFEENFPLDFENLFLTLVTLQQERLRDERANRIPFAFFSSSASA